MADEAYLSKLAAFREELKPDLLALEKSLNSGKMSDTGQIANRIKLSLEYFGFKEVLICCLDIEGHLRNNEFEEIHSAGRRLIRELYNLSRKIEIESSGRNIL